MGNSLDPTYWIASAHIRSMTLTDGNRIDWRRRSPTSAPASTMPLDEIIRIVGRGEQALVFGGGKDGILAH